MQTNFTWCFVFFFFFLLWFELSMIKQILPGNVIMVSKGGKAEDRLPQDP